MWELGFSVYLFIINICRDACRRGVCAAFSESGCCELGIRVDDDGIGSTTGF